MKAAPRIIFIVGSPRSGTTWLLSLLERHPQCQAITPEALGISPSRATKETGIFLRGFSGTEIVERFSRLPTDRILVEKTPGHLLQVGRIKRIFPDARIILAQRNPLDVIWSMVQENPFWQGRPKSLTEAVALYNTYAKAQETFVGYDAVVDYEALWDKPAEELARLLGTLGLDPGPAPQLVAETSEGKSLPPELAEVFRKGTPGEGNTHFSDVNQALLQEDLYVPGRSYQHPLSILLATNHLFGWTGSETLLLTLIQGLLERGCRLTVYVRHWNSEWLDRYFDHGIRLTNDLNAVRKEYFDLAHVQHNSCLVDVRAVFPRLPTIFSSLGVLPFLEQPIPFDLGACHYLAISEEVADNLAKHGIPRQEIHIVRNMVSGDEFFPISPIRMHPERILVLSYKMDEERKSLLHSAAKHIGASIRFAGGADAAIPHNQMCEAINDADIVVTLGRGVVESMLCGRVPLVFDIHGGDGLVTPENLQDLWRCNFSGRRYAREYTVDDLVEEFKKYRQEYGPCLREMALAHFDTGVNITRLMDLYKAVLIDDVNQNTPEYMPMMLSFFSAMAREDARLANSRLESELRLQAEITRIKSTISWRITSPLRAAWNFYRGLIGRSGEDAGAK